MMTSCMHGAFLIVKLEVDSEQEMSKQLPCSMRKHTLNEGQKKFRLIEPWGISILLHTTSRDLWRLYAKFYTKFLITPLRKIKASHFFHCTLLIVSQPHDLAPLPFSPFFSKETDTSLNNLIECRQPPIIRGLNTFNSKWPFDPPTVTATRFL